MTAKTKTLGLGAFMAASLAAAGGLIPATLSHALAAFDPATPGRLVTLGDGRRMNFRCAGAGWATVLLEGGFAATSLAWSRLTPLLADRYRVCAYDRAGYGFSDPGPQPRDGAAVARDLDAGLRAARIGGPYILVGHSAGGLYARLFADRRPREVVGMVLVDPSVEFQDQRLSEALGAPAGSLKPLLERAERCRAAAEHRALPSSDPVLRVCAPLAGDRSPGSAARLAEALRPSTWDTQISELETLWGATSREVAAGRSRYGALPLVVLTAAGTYAQAPAGVRAALDAVWSRLHQELAARSTRGREQRVERSSHMMMLDRPDAIAAAVDAVARESAPRQ